MNNINLNQQVAQQNMSVPNRFILYPHIYEITTGNKWDIRKTMVLSDLPTKFIPGVDDAPLGTPASEIYKAYDSFIKQENNN